MKQIVFHLKSLAKKIDQDRLRKIDRYDKKFLIPFIVGNLLLCSLIIIEAQLLKSENSYWTYLKDFLTLNIALVALKKAKLIKYRMYSIILNRENKPWVDRDGACKFTIFLNSSGAEPNFVEIINARVNIDGLSISEYVEVNYTPELFEQRTLKLPLYIHFKINKVDIPSKRYTGTLMVDCSYQYDMVSELFPFEYSFECVLGLDLKDN